MRIQTLHQSPTLFIDVSSKSRPFLKELAIKRRFFVLKENIIIQYLIHSNINNIEQFDSSPFDKNKQQN